MSGKRISPPPPDWFKIADYAAVRKFDFREWSVQIWNRVCMNDLLDNGLYEDFDRCFNLVKANPFADLKLSVSFEVVSPLKFGVAKEVVNALANSGCGLKDACDDVLKKTHPEIYSRQAHLFVNLQASEGEIRKHFDVWLTAALKKDRAEHKRVREYAFEEKIISKRLNSVLPHRDLYLWFKREEIRHDKAEGELIPSASVMADWLNITGDKDTILAMQKNAKAIFTLQYCHDLNHAAESNFQPIRQSKAE